VRVFRLLLVLPPPSQPVPSLPVLLAQSMFERISRSAALSLSRNDHSVELSLAVPNPAEQILAGWELLA
jgi:hypothetical protein